MCMYVTTWFNMLVCNVHIITLIVHVLLNNVHVFVVVNACAHVSWQCHMLIHHGNTWHNITTWSNTLSYDGHLYFHVTSGCTMMSCTVQIFYYFRMSCLCVFRCCDELHIVIRCEKVMYMCCTWCSYIHRCSRIAEHIRTCCTCWFMLDCCVHVS